MVLKYVRAHDIFTVCTVALAPILPSNTCFQNLVCLQRSHLTILFDCVWKPVNVPQKSRPMAFASLQRSYSCVVISKCQSTCVSTHMIMLLTLCRKQFSVLQMWCPMNVAVRMNWMAAQYEEAVKSNERKA
jgi:hypothetical protein